MNRIDEFTSPAGCSACHFIMQYNDAHEHIGFRIEYYDANMGLLGSEEKTAEEFIE